MGVCVWNFAIDFKHLHEKYGIYAWQISGLFQFGGHGSRNPLNRLQNVYRTDKQTDSQGNAFILHSSSSSELCLKFQVSSSLGS